jgi:hypothetical protein
MAGCRLWRVVTRLGGHDHVRFHTIVLDDDVLFCWHGKEEPYKGFCSAGNYSM